MMMLKNARYCDDDHRSPNIYGQIFGDTRGRFEDGTYIWTSTIQEELPDNVFRTRFSTYKVEFANAVGS